MYDLFAFKFFLLEIILNDILGLPEQIFKFVLNRKNFSKVNITLNKGKPVGHTQKAFPKELLSRLVNFKIQ